MIFAIVVGIPIGVLATVKRGSAFRPYYYWCVINRLFDAYFLVGDYAHYAGFSTLESNARFRQSE